MALIRLAQQQIDVLSRDGSSPHASEIYANTSADRYIRFDYGHIHRTGSGSSGGARLVRPACGRVPGLPGELPEPGPLRNDYIAHFDCADVVRDAVRLSVTDAAALADFCATRRPRLQVPLTSLPADRYEAKAIGARVAFVDAASVSTA